MDFCPQEKLFSLDPTYLLPQFQCESKEKPVWDLEKPEEMML